MSRDEIRLRAGGRCEYCKLPDILVAYDYQIDLIIAIKHGGSSGPDNLAWACPYCNAFKGPNIASYDEQTHQLTPLYNPRINRWDEHFYLSGPSIEGKTAIGRVTVRILNMNDPDQLATRAILVAKGLW